MFDCLLRAVVVVLGVSAAAAWTWPGPFPEADPVAVLVRINTPSFYQVVVGWYYLAPGVAVFLTGQLLLGSSRVWFAHLGVRFGLRSTLPTWPLSPTSDGPAIVIGEVHHPVRDNDLQCIVPALLFVSHSRFPSPAPSTPACTYAGQLEALPYHGVA